jgi:hypothetical protein
MQTGYRSGRPLFRGIRSTHLALYSGAANGSAKYCVSPPYFAGPKLHNADCLVGPALVFDDVLCDPEFATAHHPPNAEAGGFTGMMGTEGLQIAATVNALAGLRIVADHVLVVGRVFGLLVTDP